MKDWYQQLEARERRMVTIGGLLLLVLLPYALFWLPFTDDLQDLRKGLVSERTSLVWMKQAADEVVRKTGSAGQGSGLAGKSMLSVVDQSARQAGLGNGIKRVEPDGKGVVKVWLEDVEFDLLMRWMATMKQRYQITATMASIERKSLSGRVDVRLVLKG